MYKYIHLDSILTQPVPNKYFYNIWVCLWLLEIDFEFHKSMLPSPDSTNKCRCNIWDIPGRIFSTPITTAPPRKLKQWFSTGWWWISMIMSVVKMLFWFSDFQTLEMDVVQRQSFVPLIPAKTALIGLVMHRKLIDLRFAIICYNEIDATNLKLNANRKNASQFTYSWPLPGAHRRRIVLAYIGWAENLLETRNNGYALVGIDIFTIWSDWLMKFWGFWSRWQI